MQWSLEDIYKKQVRGNIPPRKHLNVLGEGTSEEHNINKRNDVGYRDPKTGKWRFARASNAFIKDIMEPNFKYTESSSYLKRVLEHGKKANVFEETDTINSDRVQKIYDYLTRGLDRGKVNSIVSEFPKTELQRSLLARLESAQGFNFYELINGKLGTNYEHDPGVIYMSPAGEEKRQRGASGPGEALLAFLFNGQKPQVGDLDLGGIGIELKKDEGRIGKGIKSHKVKEMAKLFVPRGAGKAKGAGNLSPDLDEKERERILEMNLGDFLQTYSGTDVNPEGFNNITVGQWFNDHSSIFGNNKVSNYNSIIPLVGALQMKDYFTKVDPFHYLAIYHDQGLMAGFTREFVEQNDILQIINHLQGKGIGFKPNNDANGYQLKLNK